MNLHWRTVNLPQSTCPSIDPPSANSCTLPKTPSQLIRHCLHPLEPVYKRPPRSQQAFLLKAASLVAPRNASRFGNRQSSVGWGVRWREGSGKLDNRNSPIMLKCWGRPVKNWRATKGNALHSQGSKALHLSAVQLKPHKHTHGNTHIMLPILERAVPGLTLTFFQTSSYYDFKSKSVILASQ